MSTPTTEIRIDPHHPDIEWKYERDGAKSGQFYHRTIGQTKWHLMHKSHITAARIRVMYEMITGHLSSLPGGGRKEVRWVKARKRLPTFNILYNVKFIDRNCPGVLEFKDQFLPANLDLNNTLWLEESPSIAPESGVKEGEDHTG